MSADRLAVLKRHRAHMTLVNTLLREGNEAGLRAIGYTEDQIEKLKQPDARGRIGYAVSLAANKHRISRLARKMKGASA